MLLCLQVLPVAGTHQVPQLRGQGGGGRKNNVHHLTEQTVTVVRGGCYLTDCPRGCGGGDFVNALPEETGMAGVDP